MAISVIERDYITPAPVSTFTVPVGSAGFWKPRKKAPAAGDLVLLSVIEPPTVLAGPPGWTAIGDGRSFWKVWQPRDSEVATFCAPTPERWKIHGYIIADGTYSLPQVH